MDPEQQVTLVYQERDGDGLRDVLRQAAALRGLARAIVLVYSPERCQVGVLGETGEPRARSEALDLAGAFEARAFSRRHELRWSLTPRGGRALLLSEDAPAGLAGWGEAARVEVERLPEHTYLLMGSSDGSAAEGWTRLVAARTRPLEVPVEAPTARVALRAVEYAHRESRHGNVHVCEERLLCLEPA
jgi:CRISPR-associated protein (TIGR03984 family)